MDSPDADDKHGTIIMRTLLFLLTGFLFSGACRLLIKLFITSYPALPAWITGIFTLFWFGITLANMITGITKAGYGVIEELIILLIIFLPPVLFLFWPASK